MLLRNWVEFFKFELLFRKFSLVFSRVVDMSLADAVLVAHRHHLDKFIL